MPNILTPIGQSFTNKPNIAATYGPYASIAAAHAALSDDNLNIIGMTFGIQVDANHIEEYWYQGGTTQAHLVKKQMVDDIPASALAGDIPASKLSSGVQTSLGKADTAYQKPGTGIPESDLASAVQTSLGKADTAYQKPGTGIPESDLASAVQTSIGKADTAVQPADIAALDGNPTGTSADGHVSVQVTEVDGVVNAVNVTTNDIASASALAGEVSRAQGAEAALDAEKADKATTLYGYGITNAYTKSEVDGLVATPHQNYVTVADYASLPATGSDDTIYRVSCWDGAYNIGVGQVDNTKYTEYAWNGTAYVLLRVMDATAEVFDISAYNNATYDDLIDALGVSGANVPADLRAGGMSVKFINTATNQYEQWRLMSATWSTTVSNWQGFDEFPTPGSRSLAESGGIMSTIRNMTSYGDDVSSSIGPWNNRNATSSATFELDESGHNGVWHLLKASGTTAERINLNCSNLSNGKTYRIKFNVIVSDGEPMSLLYAANTLDGTTTEIVDKDSGNNVLIQTGVTDVIIGKTSDWEYLIVNHRAAQGHTYPIDVVISNFNVYEYNAVNDVSNTPKINEDKPIVSDAVAKLGIINVSEEYPLQSGYYQITDNEAPNYAPNAIPTNRRVQGTILKIETSQYNYELYIFDAVSANPTSWLSPSRWKRIVNNNDIVLLDNRKMSVYSYAPNWTSLYDYAPIIDSKFNPSEKSLVLIQFSNIKYRTPLRTISINSVDYPVKHYTGRDLKLYELDETSIFEFIFKDGVFYLINPCAKTDNVIDTKDGVKLYDLGLLEIGGINTASGQDSTNSKRIRTKRNVLFKSPCKVFIKDWYRLSYVYKYTDNGYDGYVALGAAGYSGKTYESDFDGYLRLMFQSNDESDFTNVEDVGEFVKYGSSEYSVGTEILSLDNVENIITIGTSHTAGHGVIRNKSFIPYLSALYDWNFFNMGQDGCNYITLLSYILNDTLVSSGAKFSEKPKNSGIVLDFLGGSAEYVYWYKDGQGNNMEVNMKRLYSVLKSYGYDIIIGSYFDHIYSIANIQNKVAKELGLQFVNIHNECIRDGGEDQKFTPYYYNGHFCTRTVALQFYNVWKYLKLRRPRTAIKVFRNRNTVVDISELLYNDIFERVKLWDEISINHRALRTTEYNYVDRLDEYVQVAHKSDAAVTSEYTTLKNGYTIAVQDKALIEFVLPSTAGGIKNLQATFSASSSIDVYVRKYTDTSSIIPITPAQAMCTLESVAGIAVNDEFTVSNVSEFYGITLTVTDIKNNVIICDPNEEVSSFPGKVTGCVLSRVSDSAPYSCTSINRGAPLTYDSRKNEPFGIWEEVEMSGNVALIDNLTPYMEYDKISFLVESKDGESFNLYAPTATYEVLYEKEKDRFYSLEATPVNNSGNVVLVDKFGLDGSNVGGHGTIEDKGASYAWDGNETYTLNGSSLTKNHIPKYYSDTIGCSSILHLKAGTSVHYHISEFAQSAVYSSTNRAFKVTLVARYFPASNLDTSAVSFTITPETFDFGRIGIKSPFNTGGMYFSDVKYAPASFVELNSMIVLDAKASDDLIIEAIDNDVELLYIKVEKTL